MAVIKLGRALRMEVSGDLRPGVLGYLERAGFVAVGLMYLLMGLMLLAGTLLFLPFLLATGRMVHVGQGKFVRAQQAPDHDQRP